MLTWTASSSSSLRALDYCHVPGTPFCIDCRSQLSAISGAALEQLHSATSRPSVQSDAAIIHGS